MRELNTHNHEVGDRVVYISIFGESVTHLPPATVTGWYLTRGEPGEPRHKVYSVNIGIGDDRHYVHTRTYAYPVDEWLRIGRANPFIKSANDPPFTEASFQECATVEELAERLGHGNWSTGTAFYYRDLCLINQVDGGDEWLTSRHGIAFESITFGPFIKRGDFDALIGRLLNATKEQCQRLEY